MYTRVRRVAYTPRAEQGAGQDHTRTYCERRGEGGINNKERERTSNRIKLRT